MTAAFDYFVIFAEMRTGSNFLESNLNALAEVSCHGEAFNPVFVGYPKYEDLLGLTLEARDAAPFELLDRMKAAEGLNGFRYFHDHDPRVLEHVLDDPRCAKIVLTRNPLESYVSLKIARETGQWKLTNVKRHKSALVDFNADEFSAHLEGLQRFQIELMQGLQQRGQTAFYLAYEDLQNLEAMNGLAQWLGVSDRLSALDNKLKPQNPDPIQSKLSNPQALETAFDALDVFNLSRTPCFEPRRGPAVRDYIGAAETPLLFMPIAGGHNTPILRWMAALDGVQLNDLNEITGQKDLRGWMRARPGYRSFTALSHPVERAFDVFCSDVLHSKEPRYKKIRTLLRGHYAVELPERGTAGASAYRSGFVAFLDLVKRALNGQSVVRVDPRWASQSQILMGFKELCPPDFVFRQSELALDLPYLAQKLGVDASADFITAERAEPHLAEVYDQTVEDAARAAYRRDYLLFGFQDWAE
ncbi:nodulation protein NodH [Epibacterium sp. SM1969]|uniref:Nodulation protein NodH n=1 Tax=Tritonibacter aquimaris TaxID=2663379 RepID=A0A844ANK4_9RHOB|nr:sulfotransferase family 2 domain-containing protein [Tritonibacter aquimaris]MQY41923.1 nodulation protein NodH [Tritonibacter aquimaris]